MLLITYACSYAVAQASKKKLIVSKTIGVARRGLRDF